MSRTGFPRTAFVLGAGLGTRLRPLTDRLPKPLVPIFGKPLIVWAFDSLLAAGAREFIVNTHHLPDTYNAEFPVGIHRGAPLTFRHEPVLLETGGGIRNICDLIRHYPFAVYNGDILADLPLRRLAEEHAASGADLTVALRSGGGPLRVALDEAAQTVLGFGAQPIQGVPPNRVFAGVYLVGPRLMEFLSPNKIESVIPAMERLIADGGQIRGVTLDDGLWFDLGSRDALIAAHNALADNVSLAAPHGSHRQRIHPSARIAAGAMIDHCSVAAANVEVEAGATVQGCVLLDGAKVTRGVTLSGCVVAPGAAVVASATDTILA